MTREPLTLHAIVYDEGAANAALAASLLAFWKQQGWRIAGLVEENPSHAGRRDCDMLLHEITSGERFLISEYRGSMARGCRLDADALLRAAERVRSTLVTADLLILNKFGKLECEGGGLRTLIVDALDRALPTILFVPRRNLVCWESFVGPLSRQWNIGDLPRTGAAASEVLGLYPNRCKRAKTEATFSSL